MSVIWPAISSIDLSHGKPWIITRLVGTDGLIRAEPRAVTDDLMAAKCCSYDEAGILDDERSRALQGLINRALRNLGTAIVAIFSFTDFKTEAASSGFFQSFFASANCITIAFVLRGVSCGVWSIGTEAWTAGFLAFVGLMCLVAPVSVGFPL